MRKLVIWLMIVATFLLSVVSGAWAQDDSRALQATQPVSGVINTQHLTQTYSFTSQLSTTIGLTLQNSGALPLKIVIIDAAGTPITTVDDIAPGMEGHLDSWLPPADGIYYAVIYPTDALNDREGSFTLTLDERSLPVTATEEATAVIAAEATEIATVEATQVATEAATEVMTPTATLLPTEVPPTATPIAPQPSFVTGFGLQVELDWQVGARLSLEIRDPQGQSLHWKNLQTTDTGEFVGDTDSIDCATFTPHPLMQAARWQLPVRGSYEILVHTIDGCTTSAPFTVTVKLNDITFPALSGVAHENETFVGGFIVNDDGTGGLNSKSGMVRANPALAIQTSELVANGEALPTEGLVDGQIDNDQAYHSYQFEGQLGNVVTAEVKHTSGNLDTVIALLDTNGNLLAINDDSADDTTDSAINRVRLRHDGTYLIVVTRYAQLIGATEGGFELTVTGMK